MLKFKSRARRGRAVLTLIWARHPPSPPTSTPRKLIRYTSRRLPGVVVSWCSWGRSSCPCVREVVPGVLGAFLVSWCPWGPFDSHCSSAAEVKVFNVHSTAIGPPWRSLALRRPGRPVKIEQAWPSTSQAWPITTQAWPSTTRAWRCTNQAWPSTTQAWPFRGVGFMGSAGSRVRNGIMGRDRPRSRCMPFATTRRSTCDGIWQHE